MAEQSPTKDATFASNSSPKQIPPKRTRTPGSGKNTAAAKKTDKTKRSSATTGNKRTATGKSKETGTPLKDVEVVEDDDEHCEEKEGPVKVRRDAEATSSLR